MKTPYYFRFDRRTIGCLETLKRMIEGTAIGSGGAAFQSGKVDVYGLITLVLIVLRVGLSYVVSVSEPVNPIDIETGVHPLSNTPA